MKPNRLVFKALDKFGLNKITKPLEGVRTQIMGFIPTVIVGLEGVLNGNYHGAEFWWHFGAAVLGGVMTSYFKHKATNNYPKD